MADRTICVKRRDGACVLTLRGDATLVPSRGAIANLVITVGLDRVIPTVARLETAIPSVKATLPQRETVN